MNHHQYCKKHNVQNCHVAHITFGGRCLNCGYDPALLFYPCIVDREGRISKKLTREPMTRDVAENYLKTNHYLKWRMCEAIPQPANMNGLHD